MDAVLNQSTKKREQVSIFDERFDIPVQTGEPGTPISLMKPIRI
jgi:hypothetical protein